MYDRLSFTVEAMIRGYHVYKNIWSSVLDEELPCQKETGNTSDPFAVGVLKDGVIVGHVARKISSICSLFFTKERIDYLPCFLTQKILGRFTSRGSENSMYDDIHR